MNRLVRRFAVACAAVCLVVAGYASTANAAPDTTVAPCGTAWLRLWASLGERCYTGNGVISVNLTGVNREQIVGTHTVCLTAAPVLRIACAIGPRTVVIVPPVHVSRILMSTP